MYGRGGCWCVGFRFPVSEQLLYRNVQRSQGWLECKANGRLYHSTLGLRVIHKKKKFRVSRSSRLRVQGSLV